MRGSRQGDLSSPMLFILVMEALSKMMDRAVAGGYLRRFSAAVGTWYRADLTFIVRG